MQGRRTNWAGNYTYSARAIHAPEDVGEVERLVRVSGPRGLKVLGSGHSFNGIADTEGDLVSLERMTRVLHVDPEGRTVTVEGGARYGDLCRAIHARGFALPSLASLPHISVAGACATATHGSGDNVQSLAAAVSAIEMVTGRGDVVGLSREADGDAFAGAVVTLGALGIVTKITLDVVPAYEMRQDVYEGLPLAGIEGRYDAITKSAYSVSFFTHWEESRFTEVWLKRRVQDDLSFAPPASLYEARLAVVNRHPILEMPAESCTEQLGAHGPWHERLPHFRMGFTPSSGDELQSEYLIPREHACAAFRAIDALGPRIAPLLHVSEVRSVAADDLWMSPFYRQPCVGVHFTWKKDWDGVMAVLPAIEAALAPFEARPHWGKVFTIPPERIKTLFPRMGDFARLARELDPEGRLRNEFLDRYVLA